MNDAALSIELIKKTAITTRLPVSKWNIRVLDQVILHVDQWFTI